MQICGREFTETDIQWLRSQVDQVSGLNRSKQLKALQGRIKDRRLAEDDWQIVEALAETVECLNQAIAEKDTSLGRLCKYLLGAPTETAKNILKQIAKEETAPPRLNQKGTAAIRRLPISAARGLSLIMPPSPKEIRVLAAPGVKSMNWLCLPCLSECGHGN